MCHPAVVIGFQALMAVSEYQGQKKQGEATYGHLMNVREQTEASAADAARHQYQGIAERTSQARAAASLDVQNATQEYQRASATGRVSAARGGVMGSSSEAVHSNFAQRFENYHTSRMQNLSWEEAQLLANARGIQAQQRSRVEGTSFAPIAMPSPMKAAASIAASVFTAYELFPQSSWFEGWSG